MKEAEPPHFVVDTDVISFIFRNDPRAAVFQRAMTGGVVLVSFMSMTELDRWAITNRWGEARKERLAALVERFTLVLPDREMCRTWASVVAGSLRVGRPIATADAWVAATAIAQDAILVTNNVGHFAAVDRLRLFLPDGRAT